MRNVLLTPLRLRGPYPFPRYVSCPFASALYSRQSRTITDLATKAPSSSKRPQHQANYAAPSNKPAAQPRPKPSRRKRQTKKNTHAEKIQPPNATLASDSQLLLPTKAQYPLAPDKLFEFLDGDEYPEGPTFDGIRVLFGSRLAIRSFKDQTQRQPASLTAFSYDGHSITVSGRGQSKHEALRSCYLHLIARLHDCGLLQEFFGRPTIATVLTDSSKISDDKISVFELAAGSMLIPIYTTVPITEEILRQARKQGKQIKNPKFQCTIELVEHNLKVVGAGSTYSQAESAASIRFREMVQEQNNETSPLHSFDASTINSFVNFWDHGRGVLTTSVSEEKGNGGDRRLYSAQTTLAGKPIGETVIMPQKTEAENLALLTAVVYLGQQDPDLISNFKAALMASGGRILRSARTRPVYVDRETLDTMAKATRIFSGRNISKPTLSSEEPVSPLRYRSVRNVTDHERRNKTLQDAFRSYQDSPSTEMMRSKREELPINRHRSEILELVSKNPYTVVVGATGSGKTTQVPQMFLEAASEAGAGATCNVIVTQPRRIAATSVARRVADERGEPLRDSVGCIVRHSSDPPRQDGSILFCTTGVLLQQLQNDPNQVFDTTSHIVLDEVHERDILLDFLLVVLKNALRERQTTGQSVPKVVLMSATMNTELFSAYFGVPDPDGKVLPCPTIDVPGKLFPVKNRYLRDIHHELGANYRPDALGRFLKEKDTLKYLDKELKPTRSRPSIATPGTDLVLDREEHDPDESLTPVGLVAATTAHVANTTDDGAILVFLPGLTEIKATKNLLTRGHAFGVDFTDESRYKIFILHSTTPAEDQAAVFNPVPEGCRKIILSTNIAETSVTIPDVQHVVDSGKHRESRYDSINRISALENTWISKANAKQRAGRAGRVQNGNYYGLYTEERLQSMKITSKAEILRADLQEVCLSVKAHKFPGPIANFLAEALEPPSPTSVQSTVSTLQSIEALTEDEDLTPLGELLATLPIEPAMGKMVVLGIIFRCLDPILILSALSDSRSLLAKPSGLRSVWEKKHEQLIGKSQSEHIAFISAFKAVRQCMEQLGPNATREFASRQFINMAAYEQTRRAAEDIEKILVESQLIPNTPPSRRIQYQFGSEELNLNSRNIPLIKALVLMGFAPNLAAHSSGRWFRSSRSDQLSVHPKSMLASKNASLSYGGALFTYSTLFSSDDSSLMMREITEVSDATVMLLGGKLRMKYDDQNRPLMVVDDWLPFSLGISQKATLIENYRHSLDTMLSNAFQELRNYRLQNTRRESGSKLYLADDSLRDKFARSLVTVLGQLGDNSKIRSRGLREDDSKFRSRGLRERDSLTQLRQLE